MRKKNVNTNGNILTVLQNISSMIYPLYKGGIFAIVALLLRHKYDSISETRDRRRVIDHLLRQSLGDGFLAEECMFLHLFLGGSDKVTAIGRLVA